MMKSQKCRAITTATLSRNEVAVMRSHYFGMGRRRQRQEQETKRNGLGLPLEKTDEQEKREGIR